MNTPNTPSRPSSTSKVVLLVDDDQSTLMVLGKMLQREGYRVLSAASGEAALTLVGQQRLDLLVVDVVIPKLNGAELAKRLRATRPDLPILFISGLMGEASLAGKYPNSGFLAKPITQDALTAKIQNLLRGH